MIRRILHFLVLGALTFGTAAGRDAAASAEQKIGRWIVTEMRDGGTVTSCGMSTQTHTGLITAFLLNERKEWFPVLVDHRWKFTAPDSTDILFSIDRDEATAIEARMVNDNTLSVHWEDGERQMRRLRDGDRLTLTTFADVHELPLDDFDPAMDAVLACIGGAGEQNKAAAAPPPEAQKAPQATFAVGGPYAWERDTSGKPLADEDPFVEGPRIVKRLMQHYGIADQITVFPREVQPDSLREFVHAVWAGAGYYGLFWVNSRNTPADFPEMALRELASLQKNCEGAFKHDFAYGNRHFLGVIRMDCSTNRARYASLFFFARENGGLYELYFQSEDQYAIVAMEWLFSQTIKE